MRSNSPSWAGTRLIVDDFGVEYVGKQHADHRDSVLKKYHNISEDYDGIKYAGIDLKWDYKKGTCRERMDGYIDVVLTKYGHPAPKKQQLSPHKHRPHQLWHQTTNRTH